MFVCGRNVARDLLNSDTKIKKIFLQENFDNKELISLIQNAKIPYEYKKKREIDSLCPGVNQGIILSVPDYKYSDINSIIGSDRDSVVVVLDHLEDPHNVGAIVRTCEAAGIRSIILSDNRQVQINSTVMKTSVGTINNVNIVMVSNIANSLDLLKKDGYWIIGTSLNDSVDYRTIDYSGKIAIVIGNEGKGISNIVSKKCDFLVKIPMYGKTNSLNASVAAGIMIYEAIRNRK